MNTLDFIKRVLPSEGFYCAIVINAGNAPQQKFFTTMEELATNCQRLDLGGNNTYYATSTFNTRFSREQINVKLSKALFLDIDCVDDEKHEYKNQKQGLAALIKFLAATKMPKPMIVSSGRGLHVYWTLTEALAKDEWQPLADALKATFQANGFDFDPSVTADSARVLRPVGTHNPKNGGEVKVLMDGGPYDKQTLQNILGSASIAPVTYSVTSAVPIAPVQSALSAALEVKSTFTPANPDAIYSKCKQVQWAVDNQDKVEEPTWYGLIGIAAHCQDPENVAKVWSKDHPDYDEANTVNKVRQWQARTTGPTTCKKFKDLRPKGCDKCSLAGNIVSPAQCGVVHAEMVTDESTLPPGVDPTLLHPRPFHLAAVGIVKTVDGTDIEICPFDIRPVGYGMDTHLGYETVRFKWERQHVGWQDLSFRQAYLNDESREFATTISDQGIVLKGKKQTQGFQYMLRSYMDDLRNKQSMSNIYGTMGWKEDNTQFVIGERLYKRQPDGTVTTEVITLNAGASNSSKTMYTHAGSAAEWAKGIAAIEQMNLPTHLFAVCVGFSTPLWQYTTGLNGITLSLYGDTGAGKSIAQLMQQSIWGDPTKLHVSAKTTNNALYNKLGTYCHLPMTIDETTYMDNVGDFCFTVTSGQDKARMSRNAVERDTKDWATTVTVSTNISWASKLSNSGIESDAQMARLIELEIPVHKRFAESSNTGRVIAEFLEANHGIPGDIYAKAMVAVGEMEIKKRIKAAYNEFESIYGIKFTGQERYWQAQLVLTHVGCVIAEAAGLILFDFHNVIQSVVDKVQSMRDVREANFVTGFDLIREYLNETAADILTVMHTDNQPATVDAQRLPRGEVKGRFDVYRTGPLDKFDRGTVMIVRKQFKLWLAASGYDYNKLCKEIIAAGADATPQTKRCVISRDTALKSGQHYVVGLNLNNIEMTGYLDDIQKKADELTLGEMGVV